MWTYDKIEPTSQFVKGFCVYIVQVYIIVYIYIYMIFVVYFYH